MTLGERQEIFLVNIARLILWANSQGYRTRGGELERTPEMAHIYAERGIGIENSLHLRRLALDIHLFKGEAYLTTEEAHKPLGEWWEQQHPENRWGGRYGDGNHYEMVPGYINDYWKNKEGNAS